MSLPGPTGLTWALELLLFAAAFVPTGDALRLLASRWVPLFRNVGLLERGLLGLYLGGGGLYVLAALPVGLFGLPLVVGYLVGGAVVWVLLWSQRRRRPGPESAAPARPSVQQLLPGAIVVLATVVLFAIEVAVAEGVPTGNTYDTSLLTDYVSLLLLHHQIPISLAPIAPQWTSYPQGTTVWLGSAQLALVLPPARTALLVTPLFLSLSPIAGYVVGQRQLNSAWAGVAIGLTFALLGSWTRVMVATSNDFVFSFPLVLWLLARANLWQRDVAPRWGDAIGYAAVLGYSAALNPVGAEILFPTVLLLSLAESRLRWEYLRAAIPRWLGALAVALLFVIPTFWAILHGGGELFAATSGVVVPGPTAVPGITPANFIGSIDPFLFGPHAIWLSPFIVLRFELAVLLVGGAGILVLPTLFGRLGPPGPPFRRTLLATILVAIGLLLLQLAAHEGLRSLTRLSQLTSGTEISVDLFAVYTLIAAVPIVVLLDRAAGRDGDSSAPSPAEQRPAPSGPARTRPGSWTGPRVIALALALVLMVPGGVVAGADLPPYLHELYGSYGRVSAGDFAMFSWARAGLPTGARVLVAPGSAAQFLPGYARVAIVYPVQAIDRNSSYVALDSELSNGTLTATGLAALGTLAIQYIAVTGNSTNLWPPFLPAPLLADPAMFEVVFESGDAYVFQVRG